MKNSKLFLQAAITIMTRSSKMCAEISFRNFCFIRVFFSN